MISILYAYCGYLSLGLGSYNQKVGYPKEAVWYEPTGTGDDMNPPYLDPQRMQNRNLLGSSRKFWAVILHTVGFAGMYCTVLRVLMCFNV